MVQKVTGGIIIVVSIALTMGFFYGSNVMFNTFGIDFVPGQTCAAAVSLTGLILLAVGLYYVFTGE